MMPDNIKIIKVAHQGRKAALSIKGHRKPLIVSEETMLNHKLVSGIVITESQLKLLQDEAMLFQCYERAKSSLALREHSVGELINKLRQKGFTPREIEPTISKLKRLQLLDDNQYALKLAKKISSEKPCGRSVLAAHLRKKMISRELTEKTVDMVLKNTDEIDQAIAALNKRIHQYNQLELEVAKKKSYNYLARRGFSYGAAKKAFEKLLTEKKED